MITMIRRNWIIWIIIVLLMFIVLQLPGKVQHAPDMDLGPTPPTPWHQRFNPATYIPGIKSKPIHPADYWIRPLDDEFCESYYGPPYLQHIADNHVPYCESGSKSDMECFVTHMHDPLCVARGVAFTANPGEGKKKYAMDCTFRNFTKEIEADKSGKKAKELEKFQNIEDIHEYFYWTGVRMQIDQWNIGHGDNAPDTKVQGKKCDAGHNDGKITLLVKREMNHNVWHKLMELWQTMITLDALEMAPWHPSRLKSLTNQPFLTPESRMDVQVVIEDDDIGPVDELWPLLTGSAPIRQSQLNDTCLGTVILPLPGSSSPFWDSHWQDRDCQTKFMLEPFLRRIYRTLGMSTKKRLQEETVVTIIDRKGTRKIWHLQEHVEHLRTIYPNVKFQIVDFATIGLKEQIELSRNTDVLVGVMGAGMTHILFLPEDSTVVELMTPGTHYSGFRNLAKMRDLPYYTSHGLPEEEWKKTQVGAVKQAPAAAPAAAPAVAPAAPAAEPEQDWREKADNAKPDAAPAAAPAAAAAPAPAPPSAPAAPAVEVSTPDFGGHKMKRHWQDDQFLYYTEDMFTALVAAGINGQLNRGLRSGDVMPLPH